VKNVVIVSAIIALTNCSSIASHARKNCLNFTIKPSSYGILSYLSTLKFECLNKEHGCTEIIPYNQLAVHDKECKYFYSTCPNINCGQKIKWTQLENHVRNECEFSLFKCEHCGLEKSRTEYFEHIKNCAAIHQSLDVKINTFKNENEAEKEAKFTSLVDSLPDLKEISLSNFLKIILHQISLNNKEFDTKFQI